jgi:hypothetical protein
MTWRAYFWDGLQAPTGWVSLNMGFTSCTLTGRRNKMYGICAKMNEVPNDTCWFCLCSRYWVAQTSPGRPSISVSEFLELSWKILGIDLDILGRWSPRKTLRFMWEHNVSQAPSSDLLISFHQRSEINHVSICFMFEVTCLNLPPHVF